MEAMWFYLLGWFLLAYLIVLQQEKRAKHAASERDPPAKRLETRQRDIRKAPDNSTSIVKEVDNFDGASLIGSVVKFWRGDYRELAEVVGYKPGSYFLLPSIKTPERWVIRFQKDGMKRDVVVGEFWECPDCEFGVGDRVRTQPVGRPGTVAEVLSGGRLKVRIEPSPDSGQCNGWRPKEEPVILSRYDCMPEETEYGYAPIFADPTLSFEVFWDHHAREARLAKREVDRQLRAFRSSEAAGWEGHDWGCNDEGEDGGF